MNPPKSKPASVSRTDKLERALRAATQLRKSIFYLFEGAKGAFVPTEALQKYDAIIKELKDGPIQD